jgi:hypothetical protein
MKVAHRVLAVYVSPENSPDYKGRNRGAAPVSLYPKRGSNPHALDGQGILSSFSAEAASGGTYAFQRRNGSGGCPHRARFIPLADGVSPEKSPDSSVRAVAA